MKKAILTFGRMNPITSGHELLIKKIVDIAKREKGDPFVFLSKSEDKKKNPIPYEVKLKYARKFFPEVTIPEDKSIRTILHALAWLNKKGYDQFIIIVGSDRVPEFEKFEKYAGKDFQASSYEVRSAGERDPDSEGVSGMSASKMRGFALMNDFSSFRKGLPSKAKDDDAVKLFNIIKDKLNEGEEENA